MIAPIQRRCTNCGLPYETGDAIDYRTECPHCATPLLGLVGGLSGIGDVAPEVVDGVPHPFDVFGAVPPEVAPSALAVARRIQKLGVSALAINAASAAA